MTRRSLHAAKAQQMHIPTTSCGVLRASHLFRRSLIYSGEDTMKWNGIHHIRSAPYHLATNGLAERTVQTFKDAMRKVTPGDIDTILARFLFHYRTTPHCTTGLSPAELLLGRQLRTHSDHSHATMFRMHSTAKSHLMMSMLKSKHSTYVHVGDPVFVKNFSNQGTEWLPGKIIKIQGPLSVLSPSPQDKKCVDTLIISVPAQF